MRGGVERPEGPHELALVEQEERLRVDAHWLRLRLLLHLLLHLLQLEHVGALKLLLVRLRARGHEGLALGHGRRLRHSGDLVVRERRRPERGRIRFGLVELLGSRVGRADRRDERRRRGLLRGARDDRTDRASCADRAGRDEPLPLGGGLLQLRNLCEYNAGPGTNKRERAPPSACDRATRQRGRRGWGGAAAAAEGRARARAPWRGRVRRNGLVVARCRP